MIQVYFIGNDKDKKNNEQDFDDDWGDYRCVVGDHIAYWFEILELIGKGSFG